MPIQSKIHPRTICQRCTDGTSAQTDQSKTNLLPAVFRARSRVWTRRASDDPGKRLTIEALRVELRNAKAPYLLGARATVTRELMSMRPTHRRGDRRDTSRSSQTNTLVSSLRTTAMRQVAWVPFG